MTPNPTEEQTSAAEGFAEWWRDELAQREAVRRSFPDYKPDEEVTAARAFVAAAVKTKKRYQPEIDRLRAALERIADELADGAYQQPATVNGSVVKHIFHIAREALDG